jgi:hypothetical protein
MMGHTNFITFSLTFQSFQKASIIIGTLNAHSSNIEKFYNFMLLYLPKIQAATIWGLNGLHNFKNIMSICYCHKLIKKCSSQLWNSRKCTYTRRRKGQKRKSNRILILFNA